MPGSSKLAWASLDSDESKVAVRALELSSMDVSDCKLAESPPSSWLEETASFDDELSSLLLCESEILRDEDIPRAVLYMAEQMEKTVMSVKYFMAVLGLAIR